MTSKNLMPRPTDKWEGRVQWVESEQGVFVSDLYFPAEKNAVDYVEEVAIAIDELADEERTKLRNFLSFTCTVELDEASINGIKEVRAVSFITPHIITPEMVAEASEKFAFLNDLSEEN